MSTTKTRSSTQVVGARFRADELVKLDAQRALLGTDDDGVPIHARGTALKVMWQHFGDDAIAAAASHQSRAGAEAQALQPLIDTLADLASAWGARARQRQAIGVNTNQIAKRANALHHDSAADPATLNALVAVLQDIERRLDDLAAIERTDDDLIAAARRLITERHGDDA